MVKNAVVVVVLGWDVDDGHFFVVVVAGGWLVGGWGVGGFLILMRGTTL